MGKELLPYDVVLIRKQWIIGKHCIILRYVTTNYNTKIGDTTKIMGLTHITENMMISDNVLLWLARQITMLYKLHVHIMCASS